MNFEIKKQIRNILLKREEFLVEISSKNNPKKEEVMAFFKKDPEVCVIKEIQGNFGRNLFEALVFIYDNAEAKKQIEYLPRKTRKRMEEERKKQEGAKKNEEKES